jgi:hypothetical protein
MCAAVLCLTIAHTASACVRPSTPRRRLDRLIAAHFTVRSCWIATFARRHGRDAAKPASMSQTGFCRDLTLSEVADVTPRGGRDR